MWTIRHQTPETVEVVLALHSAQFTKRNVICNLSATSVTAGMVRQPLSAHRSSARAGVRVSNRVTQ
jgi:hypothetical protein